jgi:crossover junction endodeoxyribonuclease RusA
MTRSLEIDIPIPPPPLWPNARVHYMGKARAVRRYRGLCHILALAAGNQANWGPAAQTATVKATFFLPSRKRDPDNCIAALKAALDGLADAGIIANDRDLTILPTVVLSHVQWRVMYQRRHPSVILEIVSES